MTKTEYLTGHRPERYNAELIPLIKKRVNDMNELLEMLRNKAKNLNSNSNEYAHIHARYQEIEAAINWWNDLLET